MSQELLADQSSRIRLRRMRVKCAGDIMSEVLIGRGKVARVYKIGESPGSLIRKEFSPIIHVKLWNWFFYHSPHPLTTDIGHRYAYWKRKLAHRLAKYADDGINISDAFEFLGRGFTSGYVSGRLPDQKDRHPLYTATKSLEGFFNSIGMPTWSFSRKNPFSPSNFIIQERKIHIIDYEQSVPVPDSKGIIGYDTVYFDEVHNFITDKKQSLANRLGSDEAKSLEESLAMAEKYHSELDIRPKRITKFFNIGRRRS